MIKLRISDTLSLPPETVTSTLIVYGGKGMGKTNFGAVLIEEMARAGLRWSVLDPMGVWWGLRHAKDGKGKGIECLILGGAHGDIPIEPTGGAVVADLVADEDANVIIDFSRKPNGETWGVGEKIRFITDYGKRLFQRQGSLVNGKRREPLFQVLDEAARFIPQMIRAGQPELAMCLSVWAQIVEEGRNHGLGVCLLTQRSARLNKDVAELADAMIAFRTVGPNSIGAITDWLGEHVAKERTREIVERLRSLPVGRCLAVSPGWLQVEDIVQIRPRETFDSSATPKPGESLKRVTGDAAKPDLAKYAARMQETIERAKENDPAQLKRKIAQLERALIEQQAAQKKPDHTEEAIQRRINAALENQRAEHNRTLVAIVHDDQRLRDGLTHLINFCTELKEVGCPVGELQTIAPPAQPRAALPHVPSALRTVQKRTETSRAESNGDGSELSTSQRKILAVLKEFRELGFETMTKPRLAAMCEVSSTSGGYFNNLGRLRSLGLIDYRNSQVHLTEAGIGAAPEVDAPVTAQEVISRCKSVLSSSQASVLDELVKIHPRAIAKNDLAERLGVSPTSGGYFNNLGFMRTAGMIDYPSPGMVKLQDWVMLQEVAA